MQSCEPRGAHATSGEQVDVVPQTVALFVTRPGIPIVAAALHWLFGLNVGVKLALAKFGGMAVHVLSCSAVLATWQDAAE
jgi:hypothetical protein